MFEIRGMRGMFLVVVLGALLIGGSARAAGDGARRAKGQRNGVYIVQMLEDPVVVYRGGVPGMAATEPGQGQKIDPEHPAVVSYAGYLDGRHDDALRRAGGGAQALRLPLHLQRLRRRAVRRAGRGAEERARRDRPSRKDELVEADTSSTPTFLGLDGPRRPLGQLGGVGRAGEDIIIGVVDSGIWPESPSFSDRTDANGNARKDGKLDYHQIPGWHGKCDARRGVQRLELQPEADRRPVLQRRLGRQRRHRRRSGPGSSTRRATTTATARTPRRPPAATTASRRPAPAAVFGTISGMAPRARIAVYKALWSTEDASHRQRLHLRPAWRPSTRPWPTAWT